MTRNLRKIDPRGVYQRNEVLRRLDDPDYGYGPPGYQYYDSQGYDPSEYERLARYPRSSEGSGFYVFFLIVLLVAVFAFIGKVGTGGTEVIEVQPGAVVSARVASDSLYLREGPGTQYKADYILPRGWQVSILGESRRDDYGEVWVKVRVETAQGAQEGWVNQKYLRR